MKDQPILVTAGYDHTVRFWNVNNGECTRTLQFADSHANACAFSPNRRQVSVGGNSRIALFDVASTNPNPFHILDSHRGNVKQVTYDPNDPNRLISAAEDGTIKAWDLRGKSVVSNFVNKVPLNAVVLCENNIISADQDGHVKIWDVRTLKAISALQPQGSEAIQSLAISVDSSILVGANISGACYVWNVTQEALVEVLQHHTVAPSALRPPSVPTHHPTTSPVNHAQTQPQTQEASTTAPQTQAQAQATANNTVRISKITAPAATQNNQNNIADPSANSDKQNDTTSATTTETANPYTNASTTTTMTALPPNQTHMNGRPMRGPPINTDIPNSSLPATALSSNTVLSLSPLCRFQGHHRYILKCAISPDNAYIATALDTGVVKLFQNEEFFNARTAYQKTGHRNGDVSKSRPRDADYDEHGDDLDGQSEGRSKKRADDENDDNEDDHEHDHDHDHDHDRNQHENSSDDFQPITLNKVLEGHTRWVWDVEFSNDAKYIYTASSDKRAALWDVETGELIRDFVGHQKAVICLAVSK